MVYLSVLGRQPEISLAELQALFSNVKLVTQNLATFEITNNQLFSLPEANSNLISRLGGSIKLAIKLEKSPLSLLRNLPQGKITLGVSDYSKNASARTAKNEAIKLKKILVRHGRSVRIIESKSAAIPTATSLHNGLNGKNERKTEFIKHNNDWYHVIGVQDIDAYTKRDQARPARDAKVGMLPPKLAQILINLCGPLPQNSTILDPFCGTGVVLQEALLMGYRAYGTDVNDRMIEYSDKNLKWFFCDRTRLTSGGMSEASPVTTGRSERVTKEPFKVEVGDATSFEWAQPIDAVACEGYLGKPFSKIPNDVELKTQKQTCNEIILGFLKNLAGQINPDTPITIATPAWLRHSGQYERLEILDEITKLGYNVSNKTHEGLLYHRKEQIVARDILILRKK